MNHAQGDTHYLCMRHNRELGFVGCCACSRRYNCSGDVPTQWKDAPKKDEPESVKSEILTIIIRAAKEARDTAVTEHGDTVIPEVMSAQFFISALERELNENKK